MIKNSQRRIRKRQEGALARRQSDQKQIIAGAGIYAVLDERAIGIKLGIVSTDIENLAKKGIRP